MKRGGTMGWKRFEETIVLTDEERRATVGLIIAAIKANSDNPDDPVKSERNVPRYDTRDKNKVRADYNFVFKFIQNIAGWLPRQHVEFHKAVFGEEAISSDQLADLYDVTKTIIMQTVGADEVDDPRCYILKNRRTTLKLWPINLTTNNTEDSDMSKFGNKATDETKPEGPAKKKAPTRKKTSKKKVAKKTTTRKATGTSKKTAAKKAPAKRSSGPSKSDALLKLLKRAKGCSVTEAAEKLGTTDSNIRSMIGALRRSGNDITSQGNGVFKL